MAVASRTSCIKKFMHQELFVYEIERPMNCIWIAFWVIYDLNLFSMQKWFICVLGKCKVDWNWSYVQSLIKMIVAYDVVFITSYIVTMLLKLMY